MEDKGKMNEFDLHRCYTNENHVGYRARKAGLQFTGNPKLTLNYAELSVMTQYYWWSTHLTIMSEIEAHLRCEACNDFKISTVLTGNFRIDVTIVCTLQDDEKLQTQARARLQRQQCLTKLSWRQRKSIKLYSGVLTSTPSDRQGWVEQDKIRLFLSKSDLPRPLTNQNMYHWRMAFLNCVRPQESN